MLLGLSFGGCACWESIFGGNTEIKLNDKQVVVEDLTRLHIPRGNDTVFEDDVYTVTGQEPVVIHVDEKKFLIATDATGITLTRGSGKPQYLELPLGQIIQISDEGVFFPEPEDGDKASTPEKTDEEKTADEEKEGTDDKEGEKKSDTGSKPLD
jgi:hypothetical protein